MTDGFSGNIALKTAEGVAELIFTFLKNAYASSLISKVGYLLSKPAIISLPSEATTAAGPSQGSVKNEWY